MSSFQEFIKDLYPFFKTANEYRIWKQGQQNLKIKSDDWIATYFNPLITMDFITTIVNVLNESDEFRYTVYNEFVCDNDDYYNETEQIIRKTIITEIRQLGRNLTCDIGVYILWLIHHTPNKLVCIVNENIKTHFLLEGTHFVKK